MVSYCPLSKEYHWRDYAKLSIPGSYSVICQSLCSSKLSTKLHNFPFCPYQSSSTSGLWNDQRLCIKYFCFSVLKAVRKHLPSFSGQDEAQWRRLTEELTQKSIWCQYSTKASWSDSQITPQVLQCDLWSFCQSPGKRFPWTDNCSGRNFSKP